jgi:ATPase family associated with various cellular activities (AAA)
MNATSESVAHVLGRNHLRTWLEVLETRVHRAIADQRKRSVENPNRYRGVFLSNEEVDALLAGTDASSLRVDASFPSHWEGENDRYISSAEELLAQTELALQTEANHGNTSRLLLLQQNFGLDQIDVGLLISALAPDLDVRFERLYAYLHDDITRRRCTFGLSLRLLGADATDHSIRARLGPYGPLVRHGLLDVEEADRPFLSRTLRVPDRVVAHLLGDDFVDMGAQPYLRVCVSTSEGDGSLVQGALAAGARLFYVREEPGGAGSSVVANAFYNHGLNALELDTTLLPQNETVEKTLRLLVRELGLLNAGLIVTRADEFALRNPSGLRILTEASGVVAMTGARGWHPDWSRRVPIVAEIPSPSIDERKRIWQTSNSFVLGLSQDYSSDVENTEYTDVTQFARLRMRPAQIQQAVESAQLRAAAHGRLPNREDYIAGTRVLNSAALDDMSRRVVPRASWSDLVLAPSLERQVRTVLSRARHSELVLDTWGLGSGSQRRRGTVALFAGPPGTGKTLAAEVVAHELGIELFVVNIATVVDKYIGETEKNLERIFHAAEEVNGILFFDEADALFGKRSEVKDAKDRYANVETAYLLQRLETFDGITILATNLKANFDEAFARRLDVSADFNLPEKAQRAQIWRISLPSSLPLADDVSVDFLADRFELSGGNIRNVCVAAAFAAADATETVSMRHLIGALAAEYRKLGRLVVENHFAPYGSYTRDFL